MLKKIVLGSALSLLLVACTDDKSESISEPRSLQQQEVTDLSRCRGRTPVDTNLYSSKWKSRTRFSNGGTLDKVFDFNRRSLVLTGVGRFNGKSDVIEVRTEMQESSVSSFKTNGSTMAHSTLRHDNELFTFRLQLPKGRFEYSFQGPCLVLGTGPSKLVLVPSRN